MMLGRALGLSALLCAGLAQAQGQVQPQQQSTDALGWLRLASAAAGDGRIDEALRLERKVASGQGTPGPSDPRLWARLQSALKRAYDRISRSDGTRFLVERLWPRGMSKAKLGVDEWLKDVSPSTALRKWFSHDPQKWDEFRRRYRREVAKTSAVTSSIRSTESGRST